MDDRRKNTALSYQAKSVTPHLDRRREWLADRRTHTGWTRIFFIPVGRLFFEFRSVTWA